MSKTTKDPSAVALGKRRWAGISAEDRTAAATAAAQARNDSLTPERKREIAMKASKAAAKAARKRRAEKKSAARKAKADKALADTPKDSAKNILASGR